MMILYSRFKTSFEGSGLFKELYNVQLYRYEQRVKRSCHRPDAEGRKQL
jgi:hypothetical protein